jgi:drug/metabolite transporter (DMT)-like permease
MNPLFFGLAIACLVSHALQSSFLAHYSRKLDGMMTAFYRNLSLVFLLLPLLFWVPAEAWKNLGTGLPIILFSSFIGSISLSAYYEAANHLPVGIQAAIRNIVRVLLMVPLGWYFFGESLSVLQLMSMGIILLGGIGIGLHTNDFAHLQTGTLKKGFGLMGIASVVGTLSVFTMSVAIREGNPLLMGYLWESFICVFLGIFLFLRNKFTLYEFKKIPFFGWKGLMGIAAASTPAVARTTAFAIATDIGPVAVLSAITSGGILVTTLIGWFLFDEKLTRTDLAWMCVSIFGIIALKLL